MLKILLPFALASTVIAGPLIVGPVPVSGGAMLSNSRGDIFITEQFSGTNGSDSVSLYSSGIYAVPGSGSGSPGGPFGDGGCIACVRIDAVTSHYFSFFIGGDGGSSLTLFDSSHNVIASASLIGYIYITSFTYYDPSNLFLGSTETFAIVPTPEPGTIGLVLLGLVALPLTRTVLRR
jgi:hypothetical protein